MNKVRDWIVSVRHPAEDWPSRYMEYATLVQSKLENWRDGSMARLKSTVRTEDREDLMRDWKLSVDLIDRILSVPRYWCDHRPPHTEATNDCAALKLYTSHSGYDTIFRNVKAIFRNPRTPSREDQLVAAFLVELVNIDLYNKWSISGGAFEGHIHRWVRLSHEDIQRYHDTMRLPPGQRDPQIPLALDSAKAQGNAFSSPYSPSTASVSSLVNIHVFSLPGQWVDYYKSHYKKLVGSGYKEATSGIVSPICAMPIHDVSTNSYEQEVLLRGPFFQLLGISEGHSPLGAEGSLSVIDTIMINSNRDHPATPQDQTASSASGPRELFGKMVGCWRSLCCADYYRKRGNLEGEERAFAELARESIDQLESFAQARSLPRLPTNGIVRLS